MRDDDVESGGFENFDGGFGGGRKEIIIESVSPEENRCRRRGVGSHPAPDALLNHC